MKHREKENAAQSPALLHTSPGTHRPVIAGKWEQRMSWQPQRARCATNGGSWSSIKEPPRSRLLVTGRASHAPQPEVAWTLQCTVFSLSSFLPHKMRARSGPSLSPPSPNSCFSEMQKTIWTQRPDSLVSQFLSPIVSKTPLLL